LVLGNYLAVTFSTKGALTHHVKGSLALCDGAHGVVNTSTAEPTLRQHLGSIFWSKQVIKWDTNVFVNNVIVSAWVIFDFNARGLSWNNKYSIGAHHKQNVSVATV
jgi:hypothetical protein